MPTGICPICGSTDSDHDIAACRRHREAVAIIDEQEAARANICPIPVTGLAVALDMLRDGDRIGIGQLRAVVRSEDWRRLDPIERSVCAQWLRGRLPHRSPWWAAIGSILGTVDSRGRWSDAPTPETAGNDEEDTFRSLGAAEPEHAEEVLGHLAWAERVSIVHGPHKCGKTTVLAWFVARAAENGLTVLLLAPDDPVGWTTRVRQFAVDETAIDDRVRLSRHQPLAGLMRAVQRHDADVLVVDSLARVAAAEGVNLDRTQEADSIMTPLVSVAREAGCAVAVVHHEPWSESGSSSTAGRARNSTSLLAAVDASVRVTREGPLTTVVVPESVRLGILPGTWRYRLTEEGFVMETQEMLPTLDTASETAALDAAIREYLHAHPEGVSQRSVEQAVPGRAARIRERLRVVGESGDDRRWRVPSGQTQTPGRTGRTASRSASGSMGRGPDALRDAVRPESASHPIGDAPSGTHPAPRPVRPGSETDGHCLACLRAVDGCHCRDPLGWIQWLGAGDDGGLPLDRIGQAAATARWHLLGLQWAARRAA